ncbi:polyketide cyclase [Echinicola strongylocentroti]|uniref:Polyketide cyclase n=1 Tax=Echinicola strongylocentroti TaxID=1795355 RepID=A0A2Z4IF16_9BACT|nr:SRPBCC family protein [Echinicola strongylocentroti]AWW29078.1 polyketide cyclase [Echinicola strongylocentroti]
MKKITVTVKVNAPVDKAWAYWTGPEHIMRWNKASDDWHTPHAANDLREGGAFTSRMEAKDGSMGFDFSGTYQAVQEGKMLSYTLDDGREVEVVFTPEGEGTVIKETFDPEQTNPIEMQKGGWQAILDNFKKYVENELQDS